MCISCKRSAWHRRDFRHQGDCATAITLWEGIRKEVIAFYHGEGPLYGEADLQLARLYWGSKDKEGLEAAPTMERNVVEFRQWTLGPEHPMNLKVVVQLANGMVRDPSGRVNAAKILRATLKMWEATLDDNLEQILHVKEVLVVCCDVRESVNICVEVAQVRTEMNGPDHRATLKAIEHLATAHRRLDLLTYPRPDESSFASTTDMWISLVAARTKRRGVNHPDTLDATKNLALSYYVQRKVKASIKQWKKVICLREEAQGPTHEKTIGAKIWLARIYQECHQYTDAVAQWKETIHLTQNAQGQGHYDTLYCMRGLAIAYEESKQYSESETQWKVVVRLAREVRGPNHQNTLAAMRQLAVVSGKSGDYRESAMQWNEVVRLIKEAHGVGHANTLDAMSKLAESYEYTDQYAESKSQWKEVVRFTREMHGPTHEDTLDAITSLARMYEKFERYEKAQNVLVEALEQIPEDDDSWTVFCLRRSLETVRSKLSRAKSGMPVSSSLR